ncbi:2,5-diamino-6-(ribosylamino)-4(3H)-pyrimidinone 5'-phosphate reductase [Halosegnis rubeus]|jgi:2,5-diamino-6-(ribosylamino)-4(3H)-pyrimidinone 5'-phosphate reductase|uniref:2,5-diamino-6-(ribosylamino)-4(3H)-pyrimidinone 5'-phosphate reductase n=1 Tax=Halosegnis rubeus TaxID=2212850 RepID=A0A5N5U8T8_9EURY|nr:2,5-diamino-6-(ribosylamino)-4(3H)-pyrimidinone 5'-phosphate reductase [Halosegnis rubeus]KAB7514918.1 2,5-diamino-6-(ribosylamino)-4(3H)-pyrimidinone 5'-phosphate reductase [Halosegnis rubeus]KAB7518227.1 2,5-diamino-6-(ribosylamino)-4(3H)-pyrimidinone 5'-phosphate reductase [Halosegnis rubeus]KAB7519193.1 2,5-diamino-6-(ribosylamino)-4(3H)-pyrimidinone 5'-phosphate reductase [Halosegnis rubeus]
MHVHVNAAVSADGKLSSRQREQIAISGDEDFARMETIRAEADAVVVGVGTVLTDDPSLERHDESIGSEPPARVVADSRGRTPTDADILAGDRPTYLLVSAAAPEQRRRALERAGATVVVAGEDRVDLPEAFDELTTHGVSHLMVEGGGELIFSLFADELVDELTVYVGSMIIGGRGAPTLADGDGFVDEFPTLKLRDVSRLDDGVVLAYDA